MLLSALTYLILVSAFIIIWQMKQKPDTFESFGKPKDSGLGYLSIMMVTVLTIVVLESMSAVLSVLGIKDDLAQEVYDKALNKK